MRERLFFLSDVHAPYEDKRALGLALDAMEHFKPHVVVVVGDLIDCLPVSHFPRNPERMLPGGLKGEVDYVGRILDRIEAPRKLYIAGNHEDRLQRYLMDKAPELMAFTDIPRLLELERRGWEYTPYKESTKVGHLHITHDVGSAGRYNVYKALDTFQSSIVTGHTHRLGYVVEGDATGKRQVSAQFGWLGDYSQIGYMHRINAQRNWAHGFGTGIHDTKTGYVYLRPHPIVDYTCEVDGVVFVRRVKKKPRVLR